MHRSSTVRRDGHSWCVCLCEVGVRVEVGSGRGPAWQIARPIPLARAVFPTRWRATAWRSAGDGRAAGPGQRAGKEYAMLANVYPDIFTPSTGLVKRPMRIPTKRGNHL